jgi:hypothetical protein
MNLELLRLLGPRRRISLWRAVGPGAWVSVALWSAVALVALGAYRSPGFLTRLTGASAVGEAVGLLFGVVSPALLPLVVAGVACIVLPLRLFREVRRAFRGGRRYGAQRHHDGGLDEAVAGGLLGGAFGGALLGGAVDAFDGGDGAGDDGGGGGGGE